MGLYERVKNFFRKGAVTIGAVQQLNNVGDHNKISVDSDERQRIERSLHFYKNKPFEISYRNSNGRYKTREQATVNMLSKVAKKYATMVFNEQCEITVEGNAEEFIGEVFEHNDFKKNLSRYLEPMFALGGLACRPYFDRQTGQIEFSWALADAFYPLQSNTNNISECAIPFRSTRSEGDKTIYFTLIEFHEWEGDLYRITNELYRSDRSDVVGVKVPLATLHPDMEEVTYLKNLSRPLFAYVKPAGFNNKTPRSPLGLGVCDDCHSTLERINRLYDEFDQEIILGKRRIAVSEALLKTEYDEEGRPYSFFDDNETVFAKVPSANMDDFKLTDLTNDIRSQSYIASINHQLKTLEMETGLSVGTFAFDMQGVRSTKTATEVVSENTDTYQTRAMQILEVEKFVKELIVSVCELGIALGVYNGVVPTFDEISISFDDGAFNSQESKLGFYTKLVSLGYPVQKAFEVILKITEEEAEDLYQRGLKQQVDTARMFNPTAFDPFEME